MERFGADTQEREERNGSERAQFEIGSTFVELNRNFDSKFRTGYVLCCYFSVVAHVTLQKSP